jgi:hypothetical protein
MQSAPGRRARGSGICPNSSQLLIKMTRRGWSMLPNSRNRSEVSPRDEIQQSSAIPGTQGGPSWTAGAADPDQGLAGRVQLRHCIDVRTLKEPTAWRLYTEID